MVTEILICSTLQIPTFRAANTTPGDKLWKGERGNHRGDVTHRDVIHQLVD